MVLMGKSDFCKIFINILVSEIILGGGSSQLLGCNDTLEKGVVQRYRQKTKQTKTKIINRKYICI